MSNDLKPDPSDFLRELEALHVRDTATRLRKRPHDDIDPPEHKDNGEIERFHPEVPTNFSKGLHHDKFGIVDAHAFKKFVAFINQQRRSGRPFSYSDPDGKDIVLGPKNGYNDPDVGKKSRTWESPLAGHVFSMEGPDADMLTMPPAPKLGSGELAVEMAEVYALALLRDVSFSDISAGTGQAKDKIKALQGFSWFTTHLTDKKANARRIARLPRKDGDLTAQVAFRGSTDGAKKGPYLSQFMLIGNASRGKTKVIAPITSGGHDAGAHNVCPITGPEGKPAKAKDGYIVYGTQIIDQRTAAHKPKSDYLTDWASWIDAQNGANFKNRDDFADKKRFITTPRDLGSYVHYDQLYQAYLNACLIMLGYQYPFESGLPESGNHKVRDAFATFGGPHILSLVTEVASRALKFARRQKFNIHLRARPEAIAGVLTLAEHHGEAHRLGTKAKNAAKATIAEFETAALNSGFNVLDMIRKANATANSSVSAKNKGWIDDGHNYLLPMAFPEGSPMHPSYAAGHATVAGACVTILKAFFEMFEDASGEPTLKSDKHWQERKFVSLYGKTPKDRDDAVGEKVTSGIFAPNSTGSKIEQQKGSDLSSISVMGELDKLAANIAIGRDMAGVHYYTDYYESLRMGERMAVGILQEQMLTYPEKVTMRLKTFDGERMIISGNGDGVTSKVKVSGTSYERWFSR